MTTAETLAFLRGQPIADDLLSTVHDVAHAADRIKFARGEGLAPRPSATSRPCAA